MSFICYFSVQKGYRAILFLQACHFLLSADLILWTSERMEMMSAVKLTREKMVPETKFDFENMLYANWPIEIAITKFKSICKLPKCSAFMISTPLAWIYYNK